MAHQYFEAKARRIGKMTSKKHLGELLNGLPVNNPRAKVDLQLYFK